MKRPGPRSASKGFTLVELLVVMGILMLLFGIGVAFLPSVYQRMESAKGAEQLQGALARARQEARRSGRPSGVRLIDSGGGLVPNIAFVQQPIDLTGGFLTAPDPGNGQPQQVTINGADLSTINPGDYLEIGGGGLPHRITANAAPSLSLFTPLPFPINQTSQYRIMRQPQLIQGEKQVMLPSNTGVDMNMCTTDGWNPGAGMTPTGNNGADYWDICFSPGGGLTGKWTGSDKLILYIRDISQGDVYKGFPTLIVIYVRTGLIAAQPVDTSSVYKYANDPRSSGMCALPAGRAQHGRGAQGRP
jgi:type II secretory pathway pseudopilin PulG